ncbi:peptidoglycan glycosyltransferase FtsW [Oceanomicrobium pacificus]|uniref:Probable peptidoglycan glycosyltransferase FtsW n=1 Tax=Oceanomicrobium pacificus TaxID=2692916 RepID=A0A6B0TW84_9RHOB|nr:putative peptidoglycan glycosyltransferase FtsW [Oceanomicrobium pacificus]MXU65424.1 FtsW/RodA/SpoVE family cell cycle protein [Oceanomicrobium pacificus]
MTDMVYGALVEADQGEPVIPRWWRTVDRWTLAAIFGLFAIGILLGMAASVPLAQRNGLSDFYYVSRQAVFGVAALGTMCVVSMMSPLMVRRYAVLGFVAAAIAVALLPFLGTDFGKGAVRWYSLGFASVQPSEFLKPAFVVLSAWLMSASYDLSGPPGRLISFMLAVLIAALLVLQPDFGQATLLLAVWGVMYFIAGAPMLLMVVLAAGVMGAGVLAYGQSEHFARRIDGFLSADVDPRTQLGYATNAIREGGFFGVGVGEGKVKWVLPDAHTDFIIAVAAEEFGLVLCLAIMALFATIVIRSLLRLLRERDPFIRLAGAGLAVMIGMQALINIGVAVRVLPAKGMTLPFVSYGGSSVIAAGLALGMLLAFTRRRPQDDFSDILGRGK